MVCVDRQTESFRAYPRCIDACATSFSDSWGTRLAKYRFDYYNLECSGIFKHVTSQMPFSELAHEQYPQRTLAA